MKAPLKDIKKLAQLLLKTEGFYSGEIDGKWGSISNAGYADYMAFLQQSGLDIGEAEAVLEDPVVEGITGVVVLDPGHGGSRKVGGSSPNNATSASGVPEKSMTLELAKLVRTELNAIAKRNHGSKIKVHLTRSDDSNLTLYDRARFASANSADVFVSIHYNGFNGQARGTETWILSERNGNVNVAEDKALADRVQSNLFRMLQAHDTAAQDRGVKDNQKLGVLTDIHLGNSRAKHATRACLVEVEFIDVTAVDELLNTGLNAAKMRTDVARSIAHAIVQDLEANG